MKQHLAMLMVLLAAAQGGAPRDGAAQELSPTVRTIAETGAEWISGIVEARNGRFIIYAEGDSIRVRDRRTGATTSVFGRATDAIVNSLGSSASGDRLVFVSLDDQKKGPYVWTLAIDTSSGRPIGPARRVGVLPAADPSLSPDGGRIAFVERNPSVSGIAGGAVRLFTMPAGGGDATLVTDVAGRGVIRAPRWSADGLSIYFQMYPPPPRPGEGTGPSLWRVRAGGGRPDSLGRCSRDRASNGTGVDGWWLGRRWTIRRSSLCSPTGSTRSSSPSRAMRDLVQSRWRSPPLWSSR